MKGTLLASTRPHGTFPGPHHIGAAHLLRLRPAMGAELPLKG
jgi:hypothetical protein